jgi:hypothetical protein
MRQSRRPVTRSLSARTAPAASARATVAWPPRYEGPPHPAASSLPMPLSRFNSPRSSHPGSRPLLTSEGAGDQPWPSPAEDSDAVGSPPSRGLWWPNEGCGGSRATLKLVSARFCASRANWQRESEGAQRRGAPNHRRDAPRRHGTDPASSSAD